MHKTHWMVRLVQIAAVLFVLLGCLMIFIYTPFYSKLIVKSLNYFVPVEVNQLAAQSQKLGALSDDDNYEPGSDLWIARQAYLQLMEQTIQSDEPQDLTLIQARYKALQQLIEEEHEKEISDNQKDIPKVPLLNPSASEAASSEAMAENPAQKMKELLELNSAENKGLMTQYTEFLKTHEIEQAASEAEPIDDETYLDLAKMKDKTLKQPTAEPYAIVVLGGGLTLDKNDKDIVVNDYTRLRLEKTLDVERANKLPIVLSGVEAPYMQAWLKQYDVDAKLLEDRSMNTCENSRFSSLLLQKKGGAPTVILITDQYHMPRTRRLFALNGIETIPVVAPMPTTLTTWRPSEKNYDHSRRANYELLATLRDVWFGSSDCREVP
ncbi:MULTISPECIES: YdcF family protein [unclassified Acinetobacter]|uniref:YdcF family protein n=1 Tax=unclassified Acinetobacter TaxID=196816 RepID=UPI0015D276D0|nr:MULTISPECIES: YdcF family protein [unclassified Acinetobacter]UUS58807.1 YdcF family protein [Acinetobacter sp. YH16040_T]